MRYQLSAGDLAELDGMPVSLSGNSYHDFEKAERDLRAEAENDEEVS